MTIEATAATPANMRAFTAANPGRTIDTGNGKAHVEGRRCFAFSPGTGERYSADAGDYFALAPDEPLRDSDGEPMVLAVERTTLLDALTGETL